MSVYWCVLVSKDQVPTAVVRWLAEVMGCMKGIFVLLKSGILSADGASPATAEELGYLPHHRHSPVKRSVVLRSSTLSSRTTSTRFCCSTVEHSVGRHKSSSLQQRREPSFFSLFRKGDIGGGGVEPSKQSH